MTDFVFRHYKPGEIPVLDALVDELRADASAATYDELAEELELGLVITPELLRDRAQAIREHAKR